MKPNHATTGGLTAIFVAATLALSGTATADETVDGRSWYASVSGMWVKPKVSDVSGGRYLFSDLKMDAGFGLLAAVGYGADIGPRGEIELGYRKVDFDELRGSSRPGVPDSPYEGNMKTWSLMANGIYVFEAGKLRPYFGVGFGLAKHKASQEAQGTAREGSGSDNVFAYQGLLGVSYPMSESMELRGGYRYFATQTADLDGVYEGVDGVYEGAELSYGAHNFEAGIVFRF